MSQKQVSRKFGQHQLKLARGDRWVPQKIGRHCTKKKWAWTDAGSIGTCFALLNALRCVLSASSGCAAHHAHNHTPDAIPPSQVVELPNKKKGNEQLKKRPQPVVRVLCSCDHLALE